MRAVLAAFFLFATLPGVAWAQTAQPQDRARIDACLQTAKDNPERCIGVVYTPCTDSREGGTTAGMGDCGARETAVWSEKLEASLAALLTGSLGQTDAEPWNRPNENRRDATVKGRDILKDMQQTWIAWRAKKCDTLAMQAEGGTLSRVLYGSCFYEETARQALWLKSLVNDTSAR